ncbi:MAG: hypothetical protein QM473_05470 [Acidobacteriota bacterium]|nr:hypothetical protein [Acidobacteriota bacterium]
MKVVPRVILAFIVCPALGAMLGRGYVSQLVGGESIGAGPGWLAGLAIGIAMAFAVLRLWTSRATNWNAVTADLVLLSLTTLALADVFAQLARVQFPPLVHITGVVYLLSLLVVLRRLYVTSTQVWRERRG